MHKGNPTLYNENVTTRKKGNKMAASTVVTLTQANASLIIDEILSQKEHEDVRKMLHDENELHEPGINNPDDTEPKKPEPTELESDEEDEIDVIKKQNKRGLGQLREDCSIDDLNEVLGRVGLRFDNMEQTLEEYQVSLEFSQNEIDKLKKENRELKLKITKLEKEDRRNEYQVKDLDEKFERLDTVTRKRNLVFEGVPESDTNNKEDTQQKIYKVFDQMRIDHSVESDSCYRTGPYNKNRPRPIVVSFLKQSDRDYVFSQRMNLKDSKDYSKIWINEDLAPSVRRTKTMVRLIAKQAYDKGIPCRNNKFSLTVNGIKYSGEELKELPAPLSAQDLKQIQIDEKTIAYQSEHAPLSSMYPAKVKIENEEFDTSEQAFQYIRANSNNRPLLAEKILLCKKTYMIKQLGDEVKVTKEWEESEEEEAMFMVQLNKFRQNPELAAMLIATGDCELIEATPSRKWGAGATLSSNILKRHEWKGNNLHGKILMTVRAKLIREAKVRTNNGK